MWLDGGSSWSVLVHDAGCGWCGHCLVDED